MNNATSSAPDRPFQIPDCTRPEELTYAYLNLKGHPRGELQLQRLIENGFTPRLVIDEASPLAEDGRASQLRELEQVEGFRPAPSAEALCAAHGIAYETVSHHNDERTQQLLEDCDIQLAVLGDTRILKPRIIEAVPHGIVNVHPGLLPDVRGNNPYIWAVVHNLPQGVTAHLINAGVDRGPILAAWPADIPEGAGLAHLVHLLNELCADIVVEALSQVVNGKAQLTPQPEDSSLTFREARPEIRALAAKILDERAERASRTAAAL